MSQAFLADYAWLGGDQAAQRVLIETDGERIAAVTPDAPADRVPDGAIRLHGLTFPGFVNGHSHVFHRAIRGHGQRGVDSFWAWRDVMYAVAAKLDPDLLYRLALPTFAEMALAGATAVGEFFYVHHRPDGTPYDDPNEMGLAVIRAAEDAGLRITLVDTCYLQGGVDGRELTGVQRRFGDGSFDAWASRVDALPHTATARAAAAIHSVRAVPRADLSRIAQFARDKGWPIHAHVSEQPAENQEALDVFGLTPTGLLAEAGVLGEDYTAIHATHLTDDDIAAMGSTGSTVCMCCTTERDLADGVGPAGRVVDAGGHLTVGSDAHMMIDLLEDARAIETDLRLVSGRRGHVSIPELARTLTVSGARSLGWDSGRIEAGALADFTVVDLDTVRTAGAASGDPLGHVLFGANGCDVRTVIRGGQTIVDDFRHLSVPDVGASLSAVIADLHTDGP